MSKLISFKCNDIVFDVYDTERIPMGAHKYKYYITPRRYALIEAWRIKNDIFDPISSKEQLDYLIDNDFIGTYDK